MIDPDEINRQEGNAFHWKSVYKLPKLAFDHKDIILFTVDKLRDKLLKEDFVFKLMPAEFTLSELQKTFEIILDKKLDKRNFRKKIIELYRLKDLKRKKTVGAHRPAQLYSFVRQR